MKERDTRQTSNTKLLVDKRLSPVIAHGTNNLAKVKKNTKYISILNFCTLNQNLVFSSGFRRNIILMPLLKTTLKTKFFVHNIYKYILIKIYVILFSTTFCRVVETAEIVSRMAKGYNGNKSSTSSQRNISITLAKNNVSSQLQNKDKKFKTTGIIATAVQSSNNRNNNYNKIKKPNNRTRTQKLASLVQSESEDNTKSLSFRKQKFNSKIDSSLKCKTFAQSQTHLNTNKNT